MLVTGNRLNDSRVLSDITFFDLSGNEHKTIEVKIRKDVSEKKMLGKIDLRKIYNLSLMTTSSQDCSNDKGVVIIWIDPEKEPTKHIFNDLPKLKSELDAWGGKFIFLSVGTGRDLSLGQQTISGLPANTFFGIDNQMTALKNSVRLNLPQEMNLPVVAMTDKEGNIFFISAGYRIGIGEQILKSVR
jgi:hypothetical protein